jgi:peptidoglycan-associated lipoprotein
MLFFVLGFMASCQTTKNKENEVSNSIANNKVNFALNKYNLSNKSINILKTQVEFLKVNEKSNVVVEGYCDERGSKEYNLNLGKKRADAVKSFLIKSGISSKRINTISYGKDKPLVDGTGENVWAANRVAITVIK